MSTSEHPSTGTDRGGRLIDARLHLLDRQILDCDGVPVATVDDLELSGIESAGGGTSSAPRIEAILTGSTLVTRIFGGVCPEAACIESRGTTSPKSASLSDYGCGPNRWMRRGPCDGCGIRSSVEFPGAVMLLTDLLDLPVPDHNGDRVGWVCDIRFRIPARPAVSDSGGAPSPKVVGILLSPRRRGSYLGFERTDVHAPVLLARWIRWRHRGTCLVPWSMSIASRTGRSSWTRFIVGNRRC